MLELIQVSKSFKSKFTKQNALIDISLKIHEGDIFGIVGKSGVGKSTLLNILSLQMLPDSGTFLFKNQKVDSLKKIQKQKMINETSFIFQDFSLLYNLTILENIALPLKLRGISKEERLKKAKLMLEFVGLLDKQDAYPIKLSGGEVQRISIARALVTEPKILYLDEPTSSLDEATTLDILNIIKKVHQKFNITIILVSHQMSAIKYICTRVLLLEQGKIKRLGPIQNSNDFKPTYDLLWEEA